MDEVSLCGSVDQALGCVVGRLSLFARLCRTNLPYRRAQDRALAAVALAPDTSLAHAFLGRSCIRHSDTLNVQ